MSETNETISKLYGSKVFDDESMRKYLPEGIYKTLKKTIDQGKPLDASIADIVANGMKRWALDQGATHYTHWFQPMTGYTAEKHSAFINPQTDGTLLLSFSGKELVKGEPDASSFPTGGLRATFEARGYTTWDCTSPAFIKDYSLYIPTCFCSFTGEVLDKKTPLLRSMEIVSAQAARIDSLLGYQKGRIIPMVGAEQEYFLVDHDLFSEREDLRLCGRTLFGAPAPKGQEMEDHYYGNIGDRIKSFMKEVDEELWALGVPSKLEHNEVAPAQHELATVYANANVACDQNQLTMETLKKVALRHDMVCLLHEKPFAGVNGSGKHDNWSLNYADGKSLLDQGKTPMDNARFMLLLSAIIWAVDDYSDLLRLTVAGANNDLRLGGNEAPPAIVSIFLGDMLTDVLTEIETGGESTIRQGGNLEIGVTTLPKLPLDVSDRNRTSPFAFTGKKFEFRMLGSSMSIADCNTVINTIVADTLSKIADRLEKAGNLNEELNAVIRDVMRDHRRIIFNGNNYSQEWLEEAANRGLLNIRDSVAAAEAIISRKTVELFEHYSILNRKELEARYEIRMDNYAKTVNIEARTMLDMARRQIAPAVIKYIGFLASNVNAVKETGLSVDISHQSGQLKEVSALSTRLRADIVKLEKSLEKSNTILSSKEKAEYFRDKVLPAMEELRDTADKLEGLVDSEYWPIPTYTQLMFSTR